MVLHIRPQRTIVVQQLAVGLKKMVHLPNGKEPVITTGVILGQIFSKTTGSYPFVHIPSRAIKEPMYLGHKLFPATVT